MHVEKLLIKPQKPPPKKDLMQVTDATLKVTRIQVQKNNHAGLGCICPVLLLHWEK